MPSTRRHLEPRDLHEATFGAIAPEPNGAHPTVSHRLGVHEQTRACPAKRTRTAPQEVVYGLAPNMPASFLERRHVPLSISLMLSSLLLVACGGTATPPPSQTPLTCSGDLSAEQIRSVTETARSSIQRCYDAQLGSEPTLEGALNVALLVSEDGTVKSFHLGGDLQNESMFACARSVITHWRFSRPRGGCVQVNIPFRLRRGTALYTEVPQPTSPNGSRFAAGNDECGRHDTRAIAACVEGCRLGNPSDCADAGGVLWSNQQLEEAQAHLSRGCTLGSGRACNSLGLVFHEMDSNESEGTRSEQRGHAYLRGCHLGYATACSNYAVFLSEQESFRSEIDDFYRLGCEGGDNSSCLNLRVRRAVRSWMNQLSPRIRACDPNTSLIDVRFYLADDDARYVDLPGLPEEMDDDPRIECLLEVLNPLVERLPTEVFDVRLPLP